MWVIPALAQTDPISSTSGTTTVIIPDGTQTVGLVSIGQIDGNTLIVSGFLLMSVLVLVLFAVVWVAITSTRDNVSPDAVNVIIGDAFKGIYGMWDKMESKVTASDTIADDLLYNIGDIGVEAAKKYLESKGLIVTGEVSVSEDSPAVS